MFVVELFNQLMSIVLLLVFLPSFLRESKSCDPILVNTSPSGIVMDIAALPDDSFVVSYSSLPSGSIYFQMFHLNGTKKGSETLVSSNAHLDSAVCTLNGNQGFAVGWAKSTFIKVNFYDLNGVLVSGHHQPSTLGYEYLQMISL